MANLTYTGIFEDCKHFEVPMCKKWNIELDRKLKKCHTCLNYVKTKK